MSLSKKKIFITGGHSTPAAACIEELLKRGYKDITYVGQKKSILFDKKVSSEYRLIIEHYKLKFLSILAGKLSLYPSIDSLIWLLRIPVGFLQASVWFVKYRPDIVLTFGSHVGVPIVFVAKIFRVNVVAHEQTVVLGRSNRIIYKLANKVCVSWPDSIEKATKFSNKAVLTGNPVRENILNICSNVEKYQDDINKKYPFSNTHKEILFITGGNQGAHILNQFVFNNIKELTSVYNIIHQTGSNTVYNDLDKSKEYEKDININDVSYLSFDYLFEIDMAYAYAISTFLISRGGANTVTELMALSKKAIIVPIPWSSGNEQYLNGKMLEGMNLCTVVEQKDLDTVNIEEVLETLKRKKIDTSQSKKYKDLYSNAQKNIMDELEKLFAES